MVRTISNFIVKILNIVNKDTSFLEIPTKNWGHGATKTITHLQNDLNNNESELIVRVTGVYGVVMGNYNGKNYRLYEVKQVFKNGETRVRDSQYSFAEKISINEDPISGLIRGAEEELGIELDKNQIQFEKTLQHEKISSSFPGLIHIHIRHIYSVTLRYNQFNPDGYIEYQPDKTTYFEWKEEVKG